MTASSAQQHRGTESLRRLTSVYKRMNTSVPSACLRWLPDRCRGRLLPLCSLYGWVSLLAGSVCAVAAAVAVVLSSSPPPTAAALPKPVSLPCTSTASPLLRARNISLANNRRLKDCCHKQCNFKGANRMFKRKKGGVKDRLTSTVPRGLIAFSSLLTMMCTKHVSLLISAEMRKSTFYLFCFVYLLLLHNVTNTLVPISVTPAI